MGGQGRDETYDGYDDDDGDGPSNAMYLQCICLNFHLTHNSLSKSQQTYRYLAHVMSLSHDVQIKRLV